MLTLLFFIILMIILPELRGLFLLASIFTIVVTIFLLFWKRSSVEEKLPENAHYKIGAEVSNLFYDEVKRYCRKHHMTISDLIRKSVRAYMDTNR